MRTELALPVLDFRTHKTTAFVNAMGRSLVESGAFVLSHHSIPLSAIENCYASAERFFDLPLEERMQYAFTDDGWGSGYSPLFSEKAAGATLADNKHFWNQRKHTPGKTFFKPSEVPNFNRNFMYFFDAFDGLHERLFSSVCEFLGRTSFAEIAKEGDHLVRCIDYPAIPNKTDNPRAGRHRDINLLTALCRRRNQVGGLFIQAHDGQVISVDNSPEHLVIQSGIMLDIATDTQIRATPHWVENRPERRLMLVAFGHPRHEAIIGQKDGRPYTGGAALTDVLAQINNSVI